MDSTGWTKGRSGRGVLSNGAGTPPGANGADRGELFTQPHPSG